MKNFDALILGNGLIAKTLALAFEKLGMQAARVAPVHGEYKNDPRSYAIAPSSLHLFKGLGLEFPDFTLVDRVEIAMGDVLEPPLAPMENGRELFRMIDHQAINQALDEALNGDWIAGDIGEIERGEFFVELPEHQTRAPLLVVAEGKFGGSLDRLGFAFSRHDYHQRAITAKFECELPHEGVARQLFELTGPLGILPFDGSAISIVWSQHDEMAEALMALDDAEFVTLLEAKISAFYGSLQMKTPRISFPLHAAIPTRLCAQRVVLAGDSAHSIHPISGQGLNLGLRDVACLVEVVRQARRIGLDTGSDAVLEDYANWRKGDIARIAMLTRALNSFTQRQSGAIAAGRSLLEQTLQTGAMSGTLANWSDVKLDPEPPLLRGSLI